MENDTNLVAQIQEGDYEVFGKLYDKYIKKIYNYIYYKTYHRETAQDLTSQTFIKALDKINTYDLNQSSFSAWLYKIAYHTIVDHYRSQKFEMDIDDVWGLSNDNDLALDLDNKEQLEQVRKYLQKIKPEHREVLILRLWQEMSYAEISEITGLSESNCKVIFSRTIAKLRKESPQIVALLMFMKLFLN